MTVVGLDDTDSRDEGCTTYVATRLADRLERESSVSRCLLVRLNPAVEHKTRGNAALAVHTDAPPERALRVTRDVVSELAASGADSGVVVAPGAPEAVDDRVAAFAATAVRGHHELGDAAALIDDAGLESAGWGDSRGRIGALAAVGAWRAFDEWTYEHIAYRESEQWGTPREVDRSSAFAAADAGYPTTWDTVDRGEDELLCAPRTPCPVLYGVRGDDLDAVARVADRIDSEPVAAERTFVTNQGTDAHLRDGRIGALDDGYAYRVTGVVDDDPETRAGGHVFVPLCAPDGDATVECVAFEPTKRFRDRVRALRPGDRVTICGEVARGALKLEKFAVRELDRTERVVPDCPDCGRSMESAGADAGYRCRDCGTSTDGKSEVSVDRDLDPGWYEVPPRARRHVARPLVRGGFDAPVHAER